MDIVCLIKLLVGYYQIERQWDINKILKVNIEQPISLTSGSNLFSNCSTMTEVINIKNLYTDNIQSMYNMFGGCSKLTILKIDNFDTKKVKNMTSMFHNCAKLTDLNLGSFDTNNVDNINTMFCGCSNLAKLNLGRNFIIKEGLNTNTMFQYAKGNVKIKTTQAIANRIMQIRTTYNNNNFEIIN